MNDIKYLQQELNNFKDMSDQRLSRIEKKLDEWNELLTTFGQEHVSHRKDIDFLMKTFWIILGSVLTGLVGLLFLVIPYIGKLVT